MVLVGLAVSIVASSAAIYANATGIGVACLAQRIGSAFGVGDGRCKGVANKVAVADSSIDRKSFESDVVCDSSGKCTQRGSCFARGTPVLTSDGEAPIEALQPGDLVLARDVETGELRIEPVVALKVKTERPTLEMTLDGPEGQSILVVTPEHPFWVAGRGFQAAESVALGARVATSTGEDAVVVALASRAELETVFNIEVAHAHTYFVGSVHALVHNDCNASDAPPVRAVNPSEQLPPVPPMLGSPAKIREAAGGKLSDPNTQAALHALANADSLSEEDWKILAAAALWERSAKQTAISKLWDEYESRDITFNRFDRGRVGIERQDWAGPARDRLIHGIRQQDPAAIDAARDALSGGDDAPTWGGRTKIRVLEALGPVKPLPPYKRQPFTPIPWKRDTMRGMEPYIQLGIADWWAKLDEEQRARVKDAIVDLDPYAEAKLLKALAQDEIGDAADIYTNDVTQDWFRHLPIPLCNALNDLTAETTEHKRPAMRWTIEQRWRGMSDETWKSLKDELIGAEERRLGPGAMFNILNKHLFPPSDHLAQLQKSRARVLDGDLHPNAYAEFRSDRVLQMAATDQQYAEMLEETRKRFSEAFRQQLMSDPALKKQAARDAKRWSAANASQLEKLGSISWGAGDQGVSMVAGVFETLADPVGTAEGVWFMLNNPRKATVAVADAWDEAVLDPDELIGRVAFEVTLAGILSAASKPADAAEAARALNKAAREAAQVGDYAKSARLAKAAEKSAVAAKNPDLVKTAQALRESASTAKATKAADAALAAADQVANAAKANQLSESAALAKQAARDLANARAAAAISKSDEALAAIRKAEEAFARARDELAKTVQAKTDAANRLRSASAAPDAPRGAKNQNLSGGQTPEQIAKNAQKLDDEAREAAKLWADMVDSPSAAEAAWKSMKGQPGEGVFKQAMREKLVDKASEIADAADHDKKRLRQEVLETSKALEMDGKDVAKIFADGDAAAAKASNLPPGVTPITPERAETLKTVVHADPRDGNGKHIGSTNPQEHSKADGNGGEVVGLYVKGLDYQSQSGALAQLEKRAIAEGKEVPRGKKTYYVYDTGAVVGYSDGQATSIILVEVTSGTAHSHPTTVAALKAKGYPAP